MEPANTNTINSLELQEILDTFSNENRNVGLQATVIFANGTVWQGGSGESNHHQECPLTNQDYLYIGSMTKLFTATLIMQQIDAGRLSLDDSIDRWVDLPNGKDITVEMLLNHTSGLPNYTEDLWFLLRYFALPKKQWQPQELFAVIQQKPLQFTPGTQHMYSNSNYIILGMILEKVSGQSYSQLIQQLTSNDLHLGHTTYLDKPANNSIANGYDVTLLHLGRRNLSAFRTSFESGAFSAGGILSTSQDMAKFTHALFSGQIISNASLGKMKTYINAPDEDMPEQQGYGLGIRHLIINGQSFIGHTGTIPGYSGFAIYNEEQQYTIVVLSNQSIINQGKLLAQFQQGISSLNTPEP